jgi:hypothetical protein
MIACQRSHQCSSVFICGQSFLFTNSLSLSKDFFRVQDLPS